MSSGSLRPITALDSLTINQGWTFTNKTEEREGERESSDTAGIFDLVVNDKADWIKGYSFDLIEELLILSCARFCLK